MHTQYFLGALDGKHVVIQAPACAGSTYFNYKGTHDAHYRFILVDIGDAGRHSDGGVLGNSEFLEENKLSIPDGRPLLGTTQPIMPYAIVADEAFPLKTSIMRPYLESTFLMQRLCITTD